MWRSSARSAACLALGLLLTAGPAATRSAMPEIRDFADIQASPVSVTPDPSGRSAVLEVDTTIDVACSVVYGPDDGFGMIAVDDDMAGGAHRDHHPVLGDLEPDTEYRYRLQGAAADGTIYVSDVLTFRTPSASTGGPPNLALEATVTGVSSEHSEAFRAEHAIDGDLSTAWSSEGDGDEAWIEIDLGAVRAVSEVAYRSRSMGDGSSIVETFRVAADGADLGTFAAEVTVPLDIEARVLRFDVERSTGGNTGAIEILVVGEDGAGS